MNRIVSRIVPLAAALLPLSAAVAQAATVGHPGVTPSSLWRTAPSRVAPKPPVVFMRGRHVAPNQSTYSIYDVGAPSPTAYASAAPIAFNNTDQIVGSGAATAKEGAQDCLVYTGRKFVDLTPTTKDTSCSAQGISSPQGASGPYQVVGAVTTPFFQGTIAFDAGLNAKASVTSSFYAPTTDSPSEFYGVNGYQIAIGDEWYEPIGGFVSNFPPYFHEPGETSLLQPQCTTASSGCMFAVIGNQYGAACPFGGCSINDAGVVLGGDVTGNYEIYTLDSPSSAQDLPLPFAFNPSGFAIANGINNSGLVLYANVNPSAGTENAYVYDTTQQSSIALGTIPGNSCGEYVPLSFNNVGQAIGFTANCTAPGDQVYWIYDSTNGMQNLSALFPTNQSYTAISALGINDNGQILAQLFTAYGSDWGWLNPPSGAKKHRAAVRTRATTH